MSAQSTTSTQPQMSAGLERPFIRRPKTFFYGGREDSPFKRLLIHLTLALASLIALFPVIRAFGVSIRPGNKLVDTTFSLIPANATFDAYRQVLFDTAFGQWIWNSAMITIATSVIGVILAATSAYAFSRWRFPGRAPGLVFLLTTQLIPASMLLVPLYLLAFQLKLVGTYRGLVIAYSVTAVPFSIWILKGYYDTIPVDLEEAAMIDGASRLEAFWRILLPLSTPALAIVFLFNFLSAWNDYLLARVMIGATDKLLTWPLGFERFQAQFMTQWAQLTAASLIVTVPVVALFLYSAKWLISGLTLGSVKG